MAGQTLSAEGPGRLLFSEPQLFASDIERSLRFYVEKLGFEIAFKHGDPVHYAQVVRDGARLNLRHSKRTPFDPEFRRIEVDALSATIAVDGVDRLFAELSERGADFHQPLKKEEWGSKTFVVSDPDGNLVCFAGS
jgi:catechol 2,3-dioxygenase-like lactoylglutathione lyase family enzyme